jgi:glutamyl-tRNA synthetase
MRLGWSCGDQEIFTKSELENLFTLESVNKKGAIFDQAKLDWMNTQYLKKMSAEDIFSYIIQYKH